ncbi:MAG: Tex family protein [Bacteroidetes bacterium]|nr:Tex family protein [Bacteroidota bacterium]
MLSKKISTSTNLSEKQVANVIQLLEAGGTIPFIARYRKEATGSLDEVKIGEIKKQYDDFIELDKRRASIIKIIEQQGQLNPELQNQLNNSHTLQALEDLYLPYKQKRKTRASTAIEKGLEPLAKIIFSQNERNIEALAATYIINGVKDSDDALAGARDIIAEWVNENVSARNTVRNLFERQAVLYSKVKKGKEIEAMKYRDYFFFNEELKKIPSHRLLAIRRGHEEELLKVYITIPEEPAIEAINRQFIKGSGAAQNQVLLAIEDAYKRLLSPSMENEFENLSKEKADKEAIQIFSTNLRQLLLSAPLGQKRILAIDPGMRTGCKTVILNELGDLLEDTVIYPLQKKQESEQTLKHLLKQFDIEAVAIGNGTGGRETETFVRDVIKNHSELKAVLVHMVSEQGASIYSASDIAREEFPNKDITVRGAVSIGRRLKDPLAELVKIDPKSIGVGQYQHDVNAKLLKESLDQTVISCVNQVGVELNTASKHLLSYVSGLGPVLAQNIIDYRSENGKFTSRSQLKKVPRLGEKAFEQAAGFLRIHGAKNPLDNSGVHPETYAIVEQMAKDSKVSVHDLIANTELRKGIDLQKYSNEQIGLPTLTDIINELAKPGRDPRETLEAFSFGNVNSIDDLHEGMTLPGIVTNITAFGCFVDIGVHQDGLVHISQMTDKFIKSPNDVVKLNQHINVKVTEVDKARKRIGLSMKGITQ